MIMPKKEKSVCKSKCFHFSMNKKKKINICFNLLPRLIDCATFFFLLVLSFDGEKKKDYLKIYFVFLSRINKCIK